MKLFGLSHVGCCRENNEDAYSVFTLRFWADGGTREVGVGLVADGIGGHQAGEVASAVAVRCLCASVAQLMAYALSWAEGAVGPAEIEKILTHSFRYSSKRITSAAATSPEFAGMGTTAVASVLYEDRWHVAWCGDSRAYLVRHGALRQLTRDHNVLGEIAQGHGALGGGLVGAGFGQALTRHLGDGQPGEPDIVSGFFHDDDLLLLCTDGLSGVVSDDDIAEIVHKALDNRRFDHITHHLIQAALANGAPDNVTAVLACHDPPVMAADTAAYPQGIPLLQQASYAPDSYPRAGAIEEEYPYALDG